MGSTANKTIAKNTFFLYGRKIYALIVTLYISRILLQRLGIVDFGIYGLVGSVVAMFDALRGIFSSSIQRFINIAKGNGDEKGEGEIFSLGLMIHFRIALLFLIVGEIGGIVMMHYLDIPRDKLFDAYIVLQFSILTAIVTILTVPFDALIIANEKFNAYAVFSIIESTLKLLVVILLIFFPIGRLIAYAALLFVVSLIVRTINTIYCHKKFGDISRYRKVKNPKLLKQMTGFAGWQFLGNTAFTLSQNGINIVINVMGGVVVNAARTIAYQAMNAISQFIGDLNLSFQPRTMMHYAQRNLNDFFKLIYINSKANFAIASILAFIVFILASPIINVWLGEIPPYSVSFVRAIMFYLVIRSLHAPIDLFFKSLGKIRDYQIIEMCLLTLTLPLAWLLLKLGYPYFSVFLCMGVCEIINTISILILAKKKFQFRIKQYMLNVGIRVILCFCTLTGLGYCIIFFFGCNNESIFSLLLYSVALFVIASIIVIATLFSHKELESIIHTIRLKK